MSRLIAFVLIAGGGLSAAVTAGAQPVTDSRLNAYDEFRVLFAAGRYADALPHAQRIVEQTAPDAVGDPDLPRALNNLAATQLRLGDFAGAEDSYGKSLWLLQRSQGNSSPRLIEPIAGLAAALAGQGHHVGAAELYEKAIGISRSVDGLFNLPQIELLDGLAASYQAVGNYQDVELIRLYALQIAEKNYGMDDPRVSPAVLRLATWYESRRDYVAARTAYMRLAETSPKRSRDHLKIMMEALLGVGRTHRLQFTLDPQSLVKPSAVNQVKLLPVARPFWLVQGEAASLNQDGLKALQSAMDLLDAQDEPPLALRVRTLLELGDWFTAYRGHDTALSYYSRAATTLEQASNSDEPNPLAAPRLVVYRPPIAAIRHRDLPPMQTIARPARFVLTVTEKGEPEDVVVSHSEMTEMQAIKVRRALERAIYSPRFENGRPARTTGVEFTDYWFDLVPINRSKAKPAQGGG